MTLALQFQGFNVNQGVVNHMKVVWGLFDGK